jgi:EAL domain-containing protein (putative c-di-GMP-specific phosphodiesterase class I)
MSSLALIDRLLEPGALSVVFQPVYETSGVPGRWQYVEALVRGPRQTSAESPEILFEYARRKNREAEVDRACVRAILAEATELPPDTRLGVNVHASTLARDAEFLVFLGDEAARAGIAVERLVVEIVEHAPPWDVAGFRRALDTLRDVGAAIALDDIGLGQSNFLMILECRPHFMKIDRHFVHGARSDYYRQAVLDCVARLARSFSSRVVAEGVENEDDLHAATEAGIDLVQGYMFGRPCAAAELGRLRGPL